MQFKGRVAILAAVTALVSGGVLTTAPAQAATGENIPWTYTTDDNAGGKAEFAWDGNTLTVCDEQADGHAVVATLYEVATNDVVGVVEDPNSTDGCYSISQYPTNGTTVYIDVCLEKGGVESFCRASAWGVA